MGDHDDEAEPADSARKSFGLELKRLRETTGFSQHTLGERVGVSAAMLSHLEAGRRGASAKLLAKLEKALGLDADLLVELNDLAQVANLPSEVRKRLRPGLDLVWPASGMNLGVNIAGMSAGSLFNMQLRNAGSGRTDTDGRLSRLAGILREVRDLSDDDLLRVDAYVAGLKAAREAPPERP